MRALFLQLDGSTHQDRHEVTQRVLAVLGRVGFVLDTKVFSNLATVFFFESEVRHLERLREGLLEAGLLLSPKELERLEALVAGGEDEERTVRGTLRVTFVHDEPDLKGDVPAVPG